MRKMTSHKAYYRSLRNSGEICQSDYVFLSKLRREYEGRLRREQTRQEKTHD